MKPAYLSLRSLLGILCLGLVLALPADLACAQRGGDDDRRSDRDDRRDRDDDDDDRRRDRGRDRDEDGDRRRPTDQERREWFVRRMDRNGDGKIERSEVDSDRWWSYFERHVKEAGLDPSRPVNVSEYLRARQAQDRQEFRAENPTAFMAPVEFEAPPGFDTPLNETELILLNPDKQRPYSKVTVNANGSSTRTSSNSTRDESREDRTQRYARSLMERYDKNSNRILERDEWKEMRGDPEKSDLNKDGKITLDELVRRFSNPRSDDDKKEERSSDDDRRERARRLRDDSRDDGERSTYRFTTALERLPEDARSWIERYDKNDDGQVAMAEFSRTWTDSKVREYAKYDLNGDGLVTGFEYIESKKR